MIHNIDDEWMSYLQSQGLKNFERENIKNKQNDQINKDKKIQEKEQNTDIQQNIECPKCNELNISTKTKVLFLNQKIDLYDIFWKIPVMEYSIPTNGIIKKQLKVVSQTEDEYKKYQEKIAGISFYREHITKKVKALVENNENHVSRRIRYKDERKITIGISKKDIMNCRTKTKQAFRNCFALIMRLKYEDIFYEFHVKIFNSGKLEIPGSINKNVFEIIKQNILTTLQPFMDENLCFLNNSNDGVLINSDFNCGYFIDREKLYSILKSKKYGIEASYDPSRYPGVKCKFYFNNEIGFDPLIQIGQIKQEDREMKMNELIESKKYTKINFMIFRTGTGLVVANCSEDMIYFVFNFVKKILENEYLEIMVENKNAVPKNKKAKLRKKTIYVTDTSNE